MAHVEKPPSGSSHSIRRSLKFDGLCEESCFKGLHSDLWGQVPMLEGSGRVDQPGSGCTNSQGLRDGSCSHFALRTSQLCSVRFARRLTDSKRPRNGSSVSTRSLDHQD